MTMFKKIKKIVALTLAMSLGMLTLCYCVPKTPSTSPADPDPTPENPGTAPDEPPSFPPTIAVAPQKATTLLLTKSLTGFDGVTLGTLQGLAAKLSQTQILLRASSWSLYLPYMKDAGAEVSEKNADGQAWDLPSLLAYYAPELSGYILSSEESLSVAISLAGILNAVVVQRSNEKVAIDAGLSMVIDVRNLDDSWLRSSEYFSQLSRNTAVEQPASMAPKLVDYAVMAGAYFNFYDGKDADEHASMFDFLDDGAVVLGWNNVLGEYDTVKSFATLNACLIPADHAYNVSTLSSFFAKGGVNESLYASEKANQSHVESANVHTVCIVMSDGDNMQWALNDYAKKTYWYGSNLRGGFPMTWGLPALLGDLALPMMQYYADKQTDQDEFIMQLSGLGYTFPSQWDEEAKWDMAERLAEAMQTRGMRYMNILDDHGFTEQNMSAFTSQEGIEGIFYTDYANYAGYKGEILWSNGVPVVSARYRLWNSINGCDPESIASSINNAPASIFTEEGYTFIIVHAWSGLDAEGNFVANGDTMAAVNKLISLLDSDVEVVSASEFMNRLKDNIKH